MPLIDFLNSGDSRTPRKIVAIIGDLMIDRYVNGKIERISPEAPVPVLLHSDVRETAGGAANVALNVAALGCEVRLVGLIGTDPEAEGLRNILEQAGISTEWLVVADDRPTISKTRVVSGRHQIIRIDNERTGPVSPETAERIVKVALRAMAGADVVALSDYAKGVFSDPVLKTVIDAAKASARWVIADPKRKTFDAYRGVDIIKPNSAELSAATGWPCGTDEEIKAAAIALEGQFQGALLVTRSEAGMSLLTPGQPIHHLPTSALEVADVSGAGDTALAALTVALAEGRSVQEAAAWSNLAAGIAVAKFGTAVVNRIELNRAIAAAENRFHHPGSVESLGPAADIVASWRQNGDRIVFTNGCFDLIHTGHIELLTSAAREGNRLIVGLNSNASVRKLKGPNRPIQDEADRARIIGALRVVDLVVIFDELTPIEVIKVLSPDVLVKGADYTQDQVVGGDLVKARGGRIVLVPLIADRSSTKIVARMKM
jgi:D-beta-D-heptose 7-phosphate kinase / D-beta-D-heptose 1-phosphate adenosyltransferase